MQAFVNAAQQYEIEFGQKEFEDMLEKHQEDTDFKDHQEVVNEKHVEKAINDGMLSCKGDVLF